MNKKQYVLTLLVAVIAGLVGGVVANHLSAGRLTVVEKMPQQTEVISAKRFEVVDQYGDTVAELGMADSGEARLLFSGGGSEAEFSLPGVMFRDKTGRGIAAFSPSRLTLGDLQDRKGKPVTVTGGGLVLTGPNGNTVVLLVNQDGPSLWFADEDGKMRVALGRAELEHPTTGEKIERPVSSLMLWDKDGKVIWRVP